MNGCSLDLVNRAAHCTEVPASSCSCFNTTQLKHFVQKTQCKDLGGFQSTVTIIQVLFYKCPEKLSIIQLEDLLDNTLDSNYIISVMITWTIYLWLQFTALYTFICYITKEKDSKFARNPYWHIVELVIHISSKCSSTKCTSVCIIICSLIQAELYWPH